MISDSGESESAFTWGDVVRITDDAPAPFGPGRSASVCGVSQAKTQAVAERGGTSVGNFVYIIEFGDGSSVEIGEGYLEPLESSDIH